METVAATIPFLFRGEPIVTATNFSIPIESSTSDYSSSTESSTEGVHAVEETTAARGRALNMSAPEPTNSLHSNITDLSDVSMDDDDKEVEGEKTVGRVDPSAYNDRFDKLKFTEERQSFIINIISPNFPWDLQLFISFACDK